MSSRLKWKRGEYDGRDCYRLRRGDLTLAVVTLGKDKRWSFFGHVPGGDATNTLGEIPERTWAEAEVEDARHAAADWVKAQETAVASREAVGL